jgi:MYXO-CTERM domain-containing protein
MNRSILHRSLRGGSVGLVLFASMLGLSGRVGVASAGVAAAVGSVSDLAISVITVGDESSGILCTSSIGYRGPSNYYNRSKKLLRVSAIVTGQGAPTVAGRPLIDPSTPLTFELRDPAGAVVASAKASFAGDASFAVLGAKLCAVGVDAKSDAGADAGDGGAPLVEYCKDLPAGLSLAISEDEQAEARQNALQTCSKNDGGIGDGGISDGDATPVSESGCRVANEGNATPVFGVALTALGLAVLLRRRKRA